jgi:hypothetical protein
MKIIDEDGTYIDDVGGQHSCGVAWNPLGTWCGECSRTSCEFCEHRYDEEE